jgi:hypothetical protein
MIKEKGSMTTTEQKACPITVCVNVLELSLRGLQAPSARELYARSICSAVGQKTCFVNFCSENVGLGRFLCLVDICSTLIGCLQNYN